MQKESFKYIKSASLRNASLPFGPLVCYFPFLHELGDLALMTVTQIVSEAVTHVAAQVARSS